jgi:hypothetical protein
MGQREVDTKEGTSNGILSSLLRQHMHSWITVLKVKPFPMSLLT